MSKIASSGWRYARCGPLNTVLKNEKFELTPTKDQAVIKMLSAPLHRTDSAVINGSALALKRLQLQPFPRVGGCEGVGVVQAAGNSKHVKEGDTVWVAPIQGTWATHVVANAELVHKIDPKLAPLAVNASNYLIAQQLLQGYARLKKGQVVIQNGGSSVTSLAVSALAKALDVKVLTASTPGERFDGAKARHAKYGSEVFEYNGKGAQAMRKVCASAGGASLFLNGVGGREVDTFMKLMAHNGEVVTYGAQNGFGLFLSGSNFIFNEVTMQGLFIPTYLAGLTYQQRQTQLDFVLKELSDKGFDYPKATAASLDKIPEVWDDAFVHGGKKGVVQIAAK